MDEWLIKNCKSIESLSSTDFIFGLIRRVKSSKRPNVLLKSVFKEIEKNGHYIAIKPIVATLYSEGIEVKSCFTCCNWNYKEVEGFLTVVGKGCCPTLARPCLVSCADKCSKWGN